MSYQLEIEPEVIAQFPNYQVLVLYAKNLDNVTASDFALKRLREAEQQQRHSFGVEKASTHPHIMAWREAYKNFGAKPSKYPCSVEALLNRVLKGSDLPDINPVVNLYNAVSLKYVLPVGGEDWDFLESDLNLRFAEGDEPFVTSQDGEEVTSYPFKGEVIWADEKGVTCRCWNWRQGKRTQLTSATRNAYFVLDSLSPFTVEQLVAAGEDLVSGLKTISPACEARYQILEKPQS